MKYLIDSKLHASLISFTERMKSRLVEKEQQGFSRWETWKQVYLRQRMHTKMKRVLAGTQKKNDLVDIANFCLFLQYQNDNKE